MTLRCVWFGWFGRFEVEEVLTLKMCQDAGILELVRGMGKSREQQQQAQHPLEILKENKCNML